MSEKSFELKDTSESTTSSYYRKYPPAEYGNPRQQQKPPSYYEDYYSSKDRKDPLYDYKNPPDRRSDDHYYNREKPIDYYARRDNMSVGYEHSRSSYSSNRGYDPYYNKRELAYYKEDYKQQYDYKEKPDVTYSDYYHQDRYRDYEKKSEGFYRSCGSNDYYRKEGPDIGKDYYRHQGLDGMKDYYRSKGPHEVKDYYRNQGMDSGKYYHKKEVSEIVEKDYIRTEQPDGVKSYYRSDGFDNTKEFHRNESLETSKQRYNESTGYHNNYNKYDPNFNSKSRPLSGPADSTASPNYTPKHIQKSYSTHTNTTNYPTTKRLFDLVLKTPDSMKYDWALEEEKLVEKHAAEVKRLRQEDEKLLANVRKSAFDHDMASWEVEKWEHQISIIDKQMKMYE